MGIDIEVDQRALADSGIDPAGIEISIDLRDITYASAFHHILTTLNLTYVVGDGVLDITTIEKANAKLETRVYPAGDLVGFRSGDGTVHHDEALFCELIPVLVSPGTWESQGGAGSVSARDGLLVVTQSRTGHDGVAALLSVVRNAKRAHTDEQKKDGAAVTVATPAARDRVIENTLEKTVSGFQLLGTPIRQVAEILEHKLKINVQIDDRALTDAGMDIDSLTFSLEYSSTSARNALDRMLPRFDLATIVDHEVVLITTTERAQSLLELAAYDVSDLLDAAGANHANSGRKLAELIVSAVDRSTWNESGGQYCLKFVSPWNLLVVSASTKTQRKVADALTKLREAIRQQAESNLAPNAAGRDDDPIELRVFAIASVTDGDVETAGKIVELVRELLPEIGENATGGENGSYLKALPDRLVVRHRRTVLVKVEALIKQLESPHGQAATTASAASR